VPARSSKGPLSTSNVTGTPEAGEAPWLVGVALATLAGVTVWRVLSAPRFAETGPL